ncbi:MAG: sodium/glutamate symporter [Pleurocapsa sp.]
MDIFFAFIILAILLLIAVFIKQKIKFLQKLYIPESIVAGATALFLGSEVLGTIVSQINPHSRWVNGLFSATIQDIWLNSPGILINIVFAALFLGEKIPNPKDIWQKTSPQVAFGQTLAWGQYAIAISLVSFILIPLFDVNPLAATLIEIAFEGGHGTAAGMAGTLDKLGFPEGGNLALGLATVGIVTGIVAGTILIQWGEKKGYIDSKVDIQKELIIEKSEDTEILTKRTTFLENTGIDYLSINFGFTALAIAIGWLILQFLFWLESISWGKSGLELAEAVPLFPMALIGGMIIQIILNRLNLEYLVDPNLQEKIAGVAIDFLIASALAAIDLTVIGENITIFLILAIVGIIWNILAFVYLAPRIIPVYWFERGLGDMGQSMGVTATGILLIRMVDPDNKSAAMTSFAYKQLFFEPIVGGGLFTAAAPVLIVQFGSMSVLLLTSGLLIFWLTFGIINCRRIQQNKK